MGNDGGDIPKRKQLVKQKKKVQVANAQSVAIGRSRFCNLTNQKLKQPLAVCRLGSALLQKSLPEKYSYIRKLSDIKKVNIQRTSTDSQNYIACPITKLQYNGFNKFVALWSCGHVLSRKAFKQIKVQQQLVQKTQGEKHQSNKKCIICQQQYTQKDIIDLNLQGSQLQKKRNQLIQKRKPKKKQTQQNLEKLGQPTKKPKLQIHLNSIERLDGQFRDVIRQRSKFKQLFTKVQQKK